MNKTQEDILNMYQATDDVLQTHNAVWTANVPFTAAVNTFETNIDAIADLRDIQDADKTGVAEDKQNKRQSLEEQTFAAAKIIGFYASQVNNRELLQIVNFTRTELTKARDNELSGMAVQVHEAAVANAVAVLPFGLTGPMTTALGTAITDYAAYIGKPRAAVSETSAATEQLRPLFDQTTTLLEEQIDGGMELFRITNPDFYTQYFNARVIVNSPTQKRALQAKFVDQTTGKPVAHIKIKVDGSINRRSSGLGNSFVQNLTEGAHSLTTNLPGYQPAMQNFNVISGETTKLTIAMLKEGAPAGGGAEEENDGEEV
ncbi:MAG: hypothetical protein ACHQNT_00255 [Bacteroidia bacterium]